MPWVILGRIPRVAGAQPVGAAAVEAVVQAAGDAAVEAVAQAAEGVEEVEADAQAAGGAAAGDEEVELPDVQAEGVEAAEADAQEEGVEQVVADAQAAVDEEVELAADFSFPLVPTPRVTVMNAAPTAQTDPNNPDRYPYILGVHSAALLLIFGVKPFNGVYFGELPYQSNLVVVRDFDIAAVEQGHPPTATARAERIVPRDGELAVVFNIESIGFLSTPNGVHAYIIVELMIHPGSGIAKLVYIDADDDKRHQEDADSPLPNPGRPWVPSGVISHRGMLWWFDLSWGLISYDHFAEVENPLLRFHPLPEGRALDMSQPDIHNRRCITESQDELLFVEIVHDPDGNAEAAMVCMWTRTFGDNNDITIGWDVEHAVSFEEMWNDESYVETGLPRKVPVLVAVSPFRCDIVYFVLEEEERLFSIDLLTCTVFEYLNEEYDLVTPLPVPPSCRYVLPWSLPPQVAQALGIPNPDDLQLHPLEEEIIADAVDHEELQEAENQEEEEMAMEIDAELQEELVHDEQELIAEAQAILALEAVADDEELQEAEIDDEELQGAEIDDEEQPQAEIHDDDLSSEEMLKLDTDLAVKMDPETASRLKAEVNEYFSDKDKKDHPGPSQDPEDDAGLDAI